MTRMSSTACALWLSRWLHTYVPAAFSNFCMPSQSLRTPFPSWVGRYMGYDCIWAMTHRLGATQELWGQTKKELPTGRARGVVAFHATCRSWLIQALLDPGEERQDGSSRTEDGTKAPRCHPNRLFLRRRQVGSSITARLMTALCMFRALHQSTDAPSIHRRFHDPLEILRRDFGFDSRAPEPAASMQIC